MCHSSICIFLFNFTKIRVICFFTLLFLRLLLFFILPVILFYLFILFSSTCVCGRHWLWLLLVSLTNNLYCCVLQHNAAHLSEEIYTGYILWDLSNYETSHLEVTGRFGPFERQALLQLIKPLFLLKTQPQISSPYPKAQIEAISAAIVLEVKGCKSNPLHQPLMQSSSIVRQGFIEWSHTPIPTPNTEWGSSDATSHILVFGMTLLMIEHTTHQSQDRNSTTKPLSLWPCLWLLLFVSFIFLNRKKNVLVQELSFFQSKKKVKLFV